MTFSKSYVHKCSAFILNKYMCMCLCVCMCARVPINQIYLKICLVKWNCKLLGKLRVEVLYSFAFVLYDIHISTQIQLPISQSKHQLGHMPSTVLSSGPTLTNVETSDTAFLSLKIHVVCTLSLHDMYILIKLKKTKQEEFSAKTIFICIIDMSGAGIKG